MNHVSLRGWMGGWVRALADPCTRIFSLADPISVDLFNKFLMNRSFCGPPFYYKQKAMKS